MKSRLTVKKTHFIKLVHCTILGMVKTTLFGGIGGKLREKMSNGYRNCNYHLFSFYFVKKSDILIEVRMN